MSDKYSGFVCTTRIAKRFTTSYPHSEPAHERITTDRHPTTTVYILRVVWSLVVKPLPLIVNRQNGKKLTIAAGWWLWSVIYLWTRPLLSDCILLFILATITDTRMDREYCANLAIELRWQGRPGMPHLRNVAWKGEQTASGSMLTLPTADFVPMIERLVFQLANYTDSVLMQILFLS